ncbi:uncharacterized protein L203_100425 [Cryptococcus depauperatus CBS 7841]|uniref:Uncharacterized protein n=1 Tax=Cryptococcus depauperatus CBS 7841 TaxID=1295531 RepID=A0A1E3HYF7_9TREE|nr:hypothetical protein L203_05701 [Cryptococcus depauperatus CBS 7841]
MVKMKTSALILALALPAFADSHFSRSRARNLITPSKQGLEKRGATYSGRATFYDVGQGACGGWNVASDYIVALNSNQYGGGYPGPQCGRSITISYNEVQVGGVKIADECPSCAYGGLDLSRGLFARFESENAGVFYMTWWFDNEGANDQPASQEQTSTSATPTTSTKLASTSESPTSTSISTSTPVKPSASSASDYVSASGSSSTIVSNGISDAIIQTKASAMVTASSTLSGSLPFESSVNQLVAMSNLVAINQAVVNLGGILIVGTQA